MNRNRSSAVVVTCLLALSFVSGVTRADADSSQCVNSLEILASGSPLQDPLGIVSSPDGTTLFVSDFTANKIFSIPASGGTPAEIASVANTRGIAISPDGTVLYVAGWLAGNIVEIPLATGTPATVVSGLSTPHGLAVSPDGSTLYVADSSFPGSTGKILSMPTSGGVVTELNADRLYGDVSVSPDGNTLYLTGVGLDGVFTMPADGSSPPSPLPGSPFLALNHCCVTNSASPDGSTLYVHDQNSVSGPGNSPIFGVPVAGGAANQVQPFDLGTTGGFITHSPDGKALFVADSGSDSVVRLNLGFTILSSLSALKLGEFSSRDLEASCGTAPYTWSVISGTQPPGMNLNTDGEFSGTPTQPGNYSFTVRVTDSQLETDEKQLDVDVLLTLPSPELRVQKVGTVTVPGRIVDYFILIENTGSVDANAIRISEIPEPESAFSIGSASPASTFAFEEFLIWDVPTILPGDQVVLSYSALLSPEVELGASVTGAAQHTCPACETTDECQSIPIFCSLGGCDPLFGCDSAAVGCLAAAKACEQLCRVRCPPSARAEDRKTAQGPVDPNEKLVVSGRFIQPDRTLVYPIHFENIGEIEAIDVFVTDVLDSNLDESTLQIISAGGSYDGGTRTLRWDLLGRNLQPAETGNVLLSIKPLPGLPSGTEIRNSAEIQFEVFDPLVTPDVVNIIDSTVPECLVTPLPAQVSTVVFPVSWTGTDPVGEVEAFSVFVSDDGGPFTPLTEETTETTTSFVGEPGHTYGFSCVARDTAGNAEVQQPLAETTTTVVTPTCKQAGKSTLVLKNKEKNKADSLVSKWLKGELTDKTDFGDPTQDNGFNVIVTDTSGTFATFTIPPGASWKDKGKKFLYLDKAVSSSGIKKALLKPGDAGKAKVLVKGKGPGLAMPDLADLDLPVKVRIENDQTGDCWESEFLTTTKDTGEVWKAKSP